MSPRTPISPTLANPREDDDDDDDDDDEDDDEGIPLRSSLWSSLSLSLPISSTPHTADKSGWEGGCNGRPVLEEKPTTLLLLLWSPLAAEVPVVVAVPTQAPTPTPVVVLKVFIAPAAAVVAV